MAAKEVHEFLARRLKNLPQANSVALIDDAGKLTTSSRAWPPPVLDAADREYFSYLRDNNTAEAFIGPPIQSKINSAWTITIARRVNGPHGEFLGIVVAYVEANYFGEFYKAISTNDGESISLFRRDGTLLGRHPNIDQKIGEKLSTASPWYQNLAAGGGTYRTPGYRRRPAHHLGPTGPRISACRHRGVFRRRGPHSLAAPGDVHRDRRRRREHRLRHPVSRPGNPIPPARTTLLRTRAE
jgi:hypothetical protein